MKKYFWGILAVTAVWFLPRLSHPAVDIGKLNPVETVLLTVEEQGISIKTDTGAEGYGVTLEEAMTTLMAQADTNIYLDTTNKLLILGDPEAYWGEIFELFRPSCRVYGVKGNVNPGEATAYLSVHEKSVTLNRLRAGEKEWYVLTMEEGRGILEGE